MYDIELNFNNGAIYEGNKKVEKYRMNLSMDPCMMTNWVTSLAISTIILCNRVKKNDVAEDSNVRSRFRDDGYAVRGLEDVDELIHSHCEGNHDAVLLCMLNNNVMLLRAFEEAVMQIKDRKVAINYTILLKHRGRECGFPQYYLIVTAIEAYLRMRGTDFPCYEDFINSNDVFEKYMEILN